MTLLPALVRFLLVVLCVIFWILVGALIVAHAHAAEGGGSAGEPYLLLGGGGFQTCAKSFNSCLAGLHALQAGRWTPITGPVTPPYICLPAPPAAGCFPPRSNCIPHYNCKPGV